MIDKNKKTIAIVFSMYEEAKELYDHLAIVQTKKIFDYDVVFLKNDYYNIVSVVTKIGKINAAVATTLLIQNYNPDLIINLGTTGAFDPKLKLLDILSINQIYNLDANCQVWGYQPGQTPKEPAYFNTDNYKLNKLNWIIANIGSSDSFVSQDNINFFDFIKKIPIDCVDMESVGIAQTCFHLQKKLLVFKVVSDYIFSDAKTLFDDNIKKSSKIILEIFLSIFDDLKNII